jgi:hypothetical protein
MGNSLGCLNDERSPSSKTETKETPRFSEAETQILKEVFGKFGTPTGTVCLLAVTMEAFVRFFSESLTFAKILYKSIKSLKPRSALDFDNFVRTSRLFSLVEQITCTPSCNQRLTNKELASQGSLCRMLVVVSLLHKSDPESEHHDGLSIRETKKIVKAILLLQGKLAETDHRSSHLEAAVDSLAGSVYVHSAE